MKNGKFQKFAFLIGIAVMILGFGIVILWEGFGKEALLYKEVLTVNADIGKGTKITADMLQVSKLDSGQIITDAVNDPSKVIGLEAKQYIPKNSQISKAFFDTSGSVLTDDQYVFRVPSEWVIALPSSIRRKDTAVFYAIDSATEKAISANIQADATYTTSGGVHIESNIMAGRNLNTFNTSSSALLFKSLKDTGKEVAVTTVAYVKDSANREVITLSKDERFDGSSQVASLEVIVDANKLSALENAVNSGCRFLILYNEK